MNDVLMLDEKVMNSVFDNIKELVIDSRNKVYSAVNTEMLHLYWNIGRIIMQIQEGVTKEEFLQGFSLPKNKELMKVFRDLDLVEQMGTGIIRIL